MSLAEAFKTARRQLGWSQQDVATRAGITQPHYGEIERGNQRGNDESIAKIAATLGITAETLEDEGRDLAADRLRQLRASSGDTPDDDSADYDDVLILSAILAKLTAREKVWIVEHLPLFESLSQRHKTA